MEIDIHAVDVKWTTIERVVAGRCLLFGKIVVDGRHVFWENASKGSNGFINMKEDANKNLGETIKARRLARGWSITDAANAAGLHRSYWGRLEQGFYSSPSPLYLLQVAQAIELPVGELYALAGYEQPDELPTFRPYLRAKYNLPPGAISELEGYFEFLRNQYGIPKDKPVFPPKEKMWGNPPAKPKRPSNDQDQRAA